MNKSFEVPNQTYLEVFHAAQAKLLAGEFVSGKELLAQAAELAGSEEDVQDFGVYIEGTQAYIDQNVDLLREAIAKVQEPRNKAILEKFLARLESGGEVDYEADYNN